MKQKTKKNYVHFGLLISIFGIIIATTFTIFRQWLFEVLPDYRPYSSSWDFEMAHQVDPTDYLIFTVIYLILIFIGSLILTVCIRSCIPPEKGGLEECATI